MTKQDAKAAAKIDNAVERAVAMQLENTESTLRRMLEQRIAKLLGLRNEYGKWEVDSYHNSTPVTQLVDAAVADVVKRQVKPLVKEALAAVVADAGFRKSVAALAVKSLQDRLQQEVIGSAAERLGECAAEIGERVAARVMRRLENVDQAGLEDPDVFRGPLEQRLLERAAQRLADLRQAADG